MSGTKRVMTPINIEFYQDQPEGVPPKHYTHQKYADLYEMEKERLNKEKGCWRTTLFCCLFCCGCD